jgi:hypothetical protein
MGEAEGDLLVHTLFALPRFVATVDGIAPSKVEDHGGTPFLRSLRARSALCVLRSSSMTLRIDDAAGRPALAEGSCHVGIWAILATRTRAALVELVQIRVTPCAAWLALGPIYRVLLGPEDAGAVGPMLSC